jgi:hypothetical protein
MTKVFFELITDVIWKKCCFIIIFSITYFTKTLIMRKIKSALLFAFLLSISLEGFSQRELGPTTIKARDPSGSNRDPGSKNDNPGTAAQPTATPPKVLTTEEKVALEVKRRMDNLTKNEEAQVKMFGREKVESRIRDEVFLDVTRKESQERQAAENAAREERIRQEKADKEKKEADQRRKAERVGRY